MSLNDSARSSFADLFCHAQAMTALAEQHAIHEALREEEEMLTRIQTAQNKLLRELLEDVPNLVMKAANDGKRNVSLLTFKGCDVFDDDLCYLFLIKGPRERENQRKLRDAGLSPLVYTLRRICAPFGVTHTWHSATNENDLVVSW